MGERQHVRIAIIGVNGTGKSEYTARRVLPSYDLHTQKAVVISETAADNKAYKRLPMIDNLEELKALESGAVKFWDNSFPDDFILLVKLHGVIQMGYLRNGVMVFEDCTNYVDANPHRIVKKFVVNHRMYQLDLVFTTHSLTDLPKWFRKRMNYITLFKTGDRFRNENDVRALGYTNYQAVYRAWEKVMEESKTNPHYCITIPGL